MTEMPPGDQAGGRRRRSDAEENVQRILQAPSELLQAEPEAGLEEIAAAASVSRSTIYRHFGSREELVRTVRQRAQKTSDATETDALRPPGEWRAGGPRWTSRTCSTRCRRTCSAIRSSPRRNG